MNELPNWVSFFIIITVVVGIAGYIFTQTGDAFTGQGCETIKLCRNITDIIPKWLHL